MRSKQGKNSNSGNRETCIVIVSHFLVHYQHARQRTAPRDTVRRRALRCVALRLGAGSDVNAA